MDLDVRELFKPFADLHHDNRLRLRGALDPVRIVNGTYDQLAFLN